MNTKFTTTSAIIVAGNTPNIPMFGSNRTPEESDNIGILKQSSPPSYIHPRRALPVPAIIVSENTPSIPMFGSNLTKEEWDKLFSRTNNKFNKASNEVGNDYL